MGQATQTMNEDRLKGALLKVFEEYGVLVAVGIQAGGGGVVIRSQDPRVDAQNLGTVRMRPPKAKPVPLPPVDDLE